LAIGLDAVIQTLAADARDRIVQLPYIQTSDGVPASVYVGDARPYNGKPASLLSTPGITLTLTPQIAQSDGVILQIDQTIENAEGTVHIKGIGDVPITSRKLKAAALTIRDHETVVIGGLVLTEKVQSSLDIPILKEFAGLDQIYRSVTTRKEQSEMLILIRPTILRLPKITSAGP
jgi:type II secretory pathway component GspD/PulD (secretin)